MAAYLFDTDPRTPAASEGFSVSVEYGDFLINDGAFDNVFGGCHLAQNCEIKVNPEAAVCGEWFTSHGIGENIRHPRDEKMWHLWQNFAAEGEDNA